MSRKISNEKENPSSMTKKSSLILYECFKRKHGAGEEPKTNKTNQKLRKREKRQGRTVNQILPRHAEYSH